MKKNTTNNIELLPQNDTPKENNNLLTIITEKVFTLLYKNKKTQSKLLKTDDGEEIIEFYRKYEYNEQKLCTERIGRMTFNRVQGKLNGSFYIYSLDKYERIQKFYITENGEKELVKSMFGGIIEYNGENYVRISTKESGNFYINTGTHKKLYKNNKLVNFLKKKKNGDFQIDTY